MSQPEVKPTVRSADIARTPLGILKATVAEWLDDRGPRLSAALAYYTLFALAPLLVIAVSVAGSVLGQGSTRDQLVQQVLEYTGSYEIAEFVESILANSAPQNTSALATAIGIIFLLVGASNLFNELKAALNTIWDVPEANKRGFLGVLAGRILSIGMVVLTGVVLLATLVLTTALTRATAWLGIDRNAPALLTQAIGFVFSYFLTLLVLAMIYRFIPDVRISWRDVWSGAAVTALLFSIGRLLLSLYLSFSTVGSAYGAAGALAVVLLWMYWSAQIFFFGAEFTQVFARTRGSRWHEQEKLDAPVDPAP